MTPAPKSAVRRMDVGLDVLEEEGRGKEVMPLSHWA